MMPSIPCTCVSARDALLSVEWNDGTSAEFASIWLRDNLPEDRDGYSGQRLIDVTELPLQPRIRSATLADATVRVAWQDESRVSTFALDWLYEQARHCHGSPAPEPLRWLEGGQLQAGRDFAWRPMAVLQADPPARLAWLKRLLRQGIAFLSEVPTVDSGFLQAMSLVGRVAETNYGLVFDVRAVARPENLAYSDLGLGLHTDNPYREPVPGFQALHMLIASPDGGESLFADGLALAAHLRQNDPDAFTRLTGTAVPFRFQSKDADLYAERPLIQLSCDGKVTGVHYNNRSIAPLRLPLDETQAFYGAYRKL